MDVWGCWSKRHVHIYTDTCAWRFDSRQEEHEMLQCKVQHFEEMELKLKNAEAFYAVAFKDVWGLRTSFTSLVLEKQ